MRARPHPHPPPARSGTGQDRAGHRLAPSPLDHRESPRAVSGGGAALDAGSLAARDRGVDRALCPPLPRQPRVSRGHAATRVLPRRASVPRRAAVLKRRRWDRDGGREPTAPSKRPTSRSGGGPAAAAATAHGGRVDELRRVPRQAPAAYVRQGEWRPCAQWARAGSATSGGGKPTSKRGGGEPTSEGGVATIKRGGSVTTGTGGEPTSKRGGGEPTSEGGGATSKRGGSVTTGGEPTR